MNHRLSAAAIAVLLLAGACTSDDSDDPVSAPNTTSDSATTTVAEEPSSFAGELVSITIPGGWTASENDDGDGVTVAGPDVTLEVAAVPAAFFGAVFLELPTPVEPEALAELVAPVLTGDGVDKGDAEVVALNGERRAVSVPASTSDGDGEVILFDLGDGAIAIATAHTGPGLYSDVRLAVRSTVASFSLSVPVEELLAALDPPSGLAGD